MNGTPKISLKHWGRVLLMILLLTMLSVGGFAWHLIAHHNFHIVSAGRIYRSGQMNAEGLSRVIQEESIKSILNLRGTGTDQGWYQSETRTARQLGVEHYDFALSAGHEVADEEIDRILETIDRAPKPMLIHCKSGSDRTGLIGALYLYSLEGKSAESADRELTIFYGHVPYLFWRDTVAMDHSFWRYVKSHGQQPNARRTQPNGPLAKQNRTAFLAHNPADEVAP
jgi:protein tyrosine/serine phosphatase